MFGCFIYSRGKKKVTVFLSGHGEKSSSPHQVLKWFQYNLIWTTPLNILHQVGINLTKIKKKQCVKNQIYPADNLQKHH